jgi:hypothetical protein
VVDLERGVLGLLRELQERLAQSALAAGGPTPGTLEQLLLAACREAQANGAAAGVAFLDAELAKPKRTWRIFHPINVASPCGSIAIADSGSPTTKLALGTR